MLLNLYLHALFVRTISIFFCLDAQLNLGVYFMHKGNYREAEEAYRKAIELESGLAFAYINLSDLYRMQNRDDEGAGLLETAIRRIPRNADLHYALALAYIRLKFFQKAVIEVEKAVRYNPENAQMQYALYWRTMLPVIVSEQ